MTLSEQQIRDAIAYVLADRSGVSDLGLAEDFFEFGLDSLDHAQILMRLEELHDFRVADEDFDACRSIAAILAYRPQEG